MDINELSDRQRENLQAALLDHDHNSVIRQLRDFFPEAFPRGAQVSAAQVAATAGLPICARTIMRNSSSLIDQSLAGMTADEWDEAIGDISLLRKRLPDLIAAGPGALNLALLWAVGDDNAQSVEALLPHADPCAVNELGASLLAQASQSNHPGALGALLADERARASLREWGLSGDVCPLGQAAHWGCVTCMEMLLPWVDANALREYGETALMRAVRGDERECATILARKSDLSVAKENGDRAFDLAVERLRNCFDVRDEEREEVQWAIIDELGVAEPLERLRALASDPRGSAKMPRYEARREAEVLRAEFAAADQAARENGQDRGDDTDGGLYSSAGVASAVKRAPRSL